MDYEKLESAITEKTKAIIPVDLGGVICDYDKIYDIVEKKKSLFRPSTEIQKKMGRIAVVADGAHAFGATKMESIVEKLQILQAFLFMQ